MQLVDQKKQSDAEELTPAIFAALVDSLFENPVPLLAGAACAGAAGLMTAIKTGNQLLWPVAFLIVAIGLWRAFEISRYKNARTPLTPAHIVWWEWRYMLGGSLYAGSLGLWCLVVLV